jgi:hypothetical protein
MYKRTCLLVLFISIFLSVNAQSTLKERLEQHVFTLASDSFQGRKAGTEYAQMTADYIIAQWREIGIEELHVQPFGDNFQNIIAIVRGNDADLANEFIVVGAHYDHLGAPSGNIHNGADDNASGTAVLIELARMLKEYQRKLKRSVILVAFDAEEMGLLGSTYFVNSSIVPLENIVLMMSIDMVGWYQASGELQYQGVSTIQGGRELILNENLIPAGLNVVAKRFETHLFAATDTQPFAVKGIPTLAITTGTKSPYHTAEDEAHLIDFDGMVLVTKHLKNIIEVVSRDADFQSSGRVAKKHRPQQRFTFGLSANIGSNYHHYTDGAVDGKTTFSFGAGLMSQINFGALAIRPELHYDRIRAKYPAGLIATDNLTVPLSFVLQTPSNSIMGMDVFFGGYYTYRFDGKQGSEKIDFQNTFNREEFGLTYGFGMYLKPFKISFTNRTALTNFTQQANDANAHIRNRTNYFTLTYIF